MFPQKILAGCLAGLLLAGCVAGGGISQEEAKISAESFINDILLAGGEVKATVLDAKKESDLWRLQIRLGEEGAREVTSFLTLDGNIFFPEAINVEEAKQKTEEKVAQQAEELASVEGSEKPIVELFVMSYCPYGTQAEKGILPVIDILGDKIDFQLKFVDYAMHGKEEIDEQLRQYAIQKHFPEKFITYLKTFLAEGKSGDALKATGIDVMELAGYISAADTEFSATANLEDEASWLNGKYPIFNADKADNEKYEVAGSPTLVVNGKVIENAERNPASLLEIVCAGFAEAPEECSAELSAVTPPSGFGYEGEGSGGGSCE